jgi:hypothetical protein
MMKNGYQAIPVTGVVTETCDDGELCPIRCNSGHRSMTFLHRVTCLLRSRGAVLSREKVAFSWLSSSQISIRVSGCSTSQDNQIWVRIQRHVKRGVSAMFIVAPLLLHCCSLLVQHFSTMYNMYRFAPFPGKSLSDTSSVTLGNSYRVRLTLPHCTVPTTGKFLFPSWVCFHHAFMLCALINNSPIWLGEISSTDLVHELENCDLTEKGRYSCFYYHCILY